VADINGCVLGASACVTSLAGVKITKQPVGNDTTLPKVIVATVALIAGAAPAVKDIEPDKFVPVTVITGGPPPAPV
jgi:hypothetical protein